MSSGRIPIFIEYSVSRAERFAERTAAKVAIARTSVPPAVASAAIVVQSTTGASLAAPGAFAEHARPATRERRPVRDTLRSLPTFGKDPT